MKRITIIWTLCTIGTVLLTLSVICLAAFYSPANTASDQQTLGIIGFCGLVIGITCFTFTVFFDE